MLSTGGGIRLPRTGARRVVDDREILRTPDENEETIFLLPGQPIGTELAKWYQRIHESRELQ